MVNTLTARQAADELRRFLSGAESSVNAQNVQIKQQHGAGLSEVALLLQHLKDVIYYENRLQRDFVLDFVSKSNNGLELLLRTLSVLQRLLHDASQQPASRLSTLLQRNAANKRRKAGIAEADCLDCIKVITQKLPSSLNILIEKITYVEIILISVTSPQLDSKCYALETLAQLLDVQGGFMALFKALTALAGKNRDDSRMNIIVSQLKHGLNTSRLHIQILVVKFINKLLAQAPALNYRVILQAEAENAGFFADKLEKTALQFGRQPDLDILTNELTLWKNSYLSLVWLEKQAEAYTLGVQPVDYMRRSNGFVKKSSLTSGGLATKKQQYRVQQQPLTNGHWRHGTEDDAIFLETNPSYSPFPYARERTRQNRPAVRTYSMPPYARGGGETAPRTEGILKRTKSEQGLNTYTPQDSLRSNISMQRRTPREEQIFRQLNGKRPVSPVRFADEEAAKEIRRRPPQPSPSSDGREWTIPVRLGNEPAPPLGNGAGSRGYNGLHHPPLATMTETPGNFSASPERTASPTDRRVRRSASTVSEKARMQGFSYLFPEKPIIDDLPRRRSKTPTPLQEQAILQNSEYNNTANGHHADYRNGGAFVPPTTATSVHQNGSLPHNKGYTNGHATNGNAQQYNTASLQRRRDGEVIYIPVRVEETGNVINQRSNRRSAPPPGGASSRRYGRDVEDALKRFDYLNDYSGDDHYGGSGSSKFGMSRDNRFST